MSEVRAVAHELDDLLLEVRCVVYSALGTGPAQDLTRIARGDAGASRLDAAIGALLVLVTMERR
jgi:hypothetical protein